MSRSRRSFFGLLLATPAILQARVSSTMQAIGYHLTTLAVTARKAEHVDLMGALSVLGIACMQDKAGHKIAFDSRKENGSTVATITVTLVGGDDA
jgi:hypothetical protein